VKASEFGIKTFELCESRMCSLWNFRMYTGEGTVFKTAFVINSKTNTDYYMQSIAHII